MAKKGSKKSKKAADKVEAEIPKVKRGRGRPKKTTSTTEGPLPNTAEKETAAVSVRPRKVPDIKFQNLFEHQRTFPPQRPVSAANEGIGQAISAIRRQMSPNKKDLRENGRCRGAKAPKYFALHEWTKPDFESPDASDVEDLTDEDEACTSGVAKNVPHSAPSDNASDHTDTEAIPDEKEQVQRFIDYETYEETCETLKAAIELLEKIGNGFKHFNLLKDWESPKLPPMKRPFIHSKSNCFWNYHATSSSDRPAPKGNAPLDIVQHTAVVAKDDDEMDTIIGESEGHGAAVNQEIDPLQPAIYSNAPDYENTIADVSREIEEMRTNEDLEINKMDAHKEVLANVSDSDDSSGHEKTFNSNHADNDDDCVLYLAENHGRVVEDSAVSDIQKYPGIQEATVEPTPIGIEIKDEKEEQNKPTRDQSFLEMVARRRLLFLNAETTDTNELRAYLQATEVQHLMNGMEEWQDLIREMRKYSTPAEVRQFFVKFLAYCPPKRAKVFFYLNREWMSDHNIDWTKQESFAHALKHIQWLLGFHKLTLQNFDLQELFKERDLPTTMDDFCKSEESDDQIEKRFIIGMAEDPKHYQIHCTLFNVRIILETIDKRKLFFACCPNAMKNLHCYEGIAHMIRNDDQRLVCVAQTESMTFLLSFGKTVQQIQLDLSDKILRRIVHMNLDAGAVWIIGAIIWNEREVEAEKVSNSLKIICEDLNKITKSEPWTAAQHHERYKDITTEIVDTVPITTSDLQEFARNLSKNKYLLLRSRDTRKPLVIEVEDEDNDIQKFNQGPASPIPAVTVPTTSTEPLDLIPTEQLEKDVLASTTKKLAETSGQSKSTSFEKSNTPTAYAVNNQVDISAPKLIESSVKSETDVSERMILSNNLNDNSSESMSRDKRILSNFKQNILKRSVPEARDLGTKEVTPKARRLQLVTPAPSTIRKPSPEYVYLTSSDDESSSNTAAVTRKVSILIKLPHHNLPGLGYLKQIGYFVQLEREELERLREIAGAVSEEDIKKMWFNDSIIDFALCCLAIKHLNRDQWKSIWLATSQLFGSLTYEGANHLCFCYENRIEKNRMLLLEKCNKIHEQTEDVDLFAKKLFIIPVNAHGHWMLALVINPIGAFLVSKPEEDNNKCFIIVLNSWPYKKPQREKHIKYVIVEWMRKAGEVKNLGRKLNENQIVVVQPEEVPHQGNGYDCGPFVCYFFKKIMQSLDKFINQIDFSAPLNWAIIDPDSAFETVRQDVVDGVLKHTDRATQVRIANEIGIRTSNRK